MMRPMRTRAYGPGFLGDPQAPQAYGDDLMTPDFTAEVYGNNLMAPVMKNAPSGNPMSPPPERGRVSARERVGAFLLQQGGQGDLGSMLLEKRQRDLDDAYRRQMLDYQRMGAR